MKEVLVVRSEVVVGQGPEGWGGRDAGHDVTALARKLAAAEHVTLAVDAAAADAEMKSSHCDAMLLWPYLLEQHSQPTQTLLLTELKLTEGAT